MSQDLRTVDPAELRLPSSRAGGPDPLKLHRQIGRYGYSTAGMPPVWVYEGSDALFEIIDGVTRATRIAKLAPGRTIVVEVIGRLHRPVAGRPRVGDRM